MDNIYSLQKYFHRKIVLGKQIFFCKMFYLDAHYISFLTDKYVNILKSENKEQDIRFSFRKKIRPKTI